jgi:uncharacterized membrane protein
MFDNYLNGRVLISMTMNEHLFYLINYQYDFLSVVTHVLFVFIFFFGSSCFLPVIVRPSVYTFFMIELRTALIMRYFLFFVIA